MFIFLILIEFLLYYSLELKTWKDLQYNDKNQTRIIVYLISLTRSINPSL